MGTGFPLAAQRPIITAHKSLGDYAPIVGDDAVAEIERLAGPLRGARIAHVSATARGGGVVEILQTLVPLMRSIGLDAEWYVTPGSAAFFDVTKRMHNGLQGADADFTPAMQSTFLSNNAEIAAGFQGQFDFVVVHDPQPAPLRLMRPRDGGKWIWRCHIDLTQANPAYWAFVRPFVEAYDAAIFTMPGFVQPNLQIGTLAIIPPGIDPLSAKNRPMGPHPIADIVASAGVDPARPSLVQVSRFDPWKDPLGVIDVFRAVRQQLPGLQLVMLGAMADDDPEGIEYFRRTQAYAEGDQDIQVLINRGGSRQVNAFQRHAAVILQKSLREGFGLTVTEALWKARPVVGGNVGGIPLQIEDGVTGYLVESVEKCAARVLDLLRDPEAAAQLGMRGREVVRRRFLCTANLRDNLRLLNQLAGNA